MVLSSSKEDLGIPTKFLTGHVVLKYHLRKLGKTEDQTCRLWREDLEMAEHILCESIAVSRI